MIDITIYILLIAGLVLIFIVAALTMNSIKTAPYQPEPYEIKPIYKLKSLQSFVKEGKQNISLVNSKLEQIQKNGEIFQKEQWQEIQTQVLAIVENINTFEYFNEDVYERLLGIREKLYENFNVLGTNSIENLKNKQIKLKQDVLREIEYINNHELLMDFGCNFTILKHNVDNFIAYCQKHTQNSVFDEMNKMKTLSDSELSSADNSFRTIKDNDPPIDVQLYELLIGIFKKENQSLMEKIRFVAKNDGKMEEINNKIEEEQLAINNFYTGMAELQVFLAEILTLTEKIIQNKNEDYIIER